MPRTVVGARLTHACACMRVQVHATVFGLLSDGLTPARVAIVGFSQGAALAAEASLTLGVPLAGWGMLSGWLSLRARGALARSANGRAGARVLVCHSTADEEVDMGCARLASKLLVAAGSSVDFKAICGQLHVASAPHGQRNALAFLDDVLSGAAAPNRHGLAVPKAAKPTSGR